MRKIACFFFLMVWAHALKVDITYGREQNSPFSIITLTHAKPFACQTLSREDYSSDIIECIIKETPEAGFLPFDTNFFEVSYEMVDQKFHLIIKSKKHQRLLFIPDDIQDSGFFVQRRDKFSRTWQIVGYEKKLPFLSEKKPLGINFPISLSRQKYPFVGEIGVDKNPMNTNLGADYAEYLKVKDLVDSQSYRAALNNIANAFKKYPKTLFAKDFLFFQIKALYHLKRYDSAIDYANAWLKNYSSDTSVPEMLYLVANSYARLRFPSESNYYYRRIIDEYPGNRFAALSKIKIANMFAGGSNVGLARLYYSQAYQEAKNLNDAVDIAMEWALFEIQSNSLANARDLFEKSFHANPKYFTEHQDQTLNLLGVLKEHKMDDIAAKIAQYFVDHINKQEANYEKVLFLLGELYEGAGQFDRAHVANLAYLKEYDGLVGAKEVQRRDDNLLFELSGSAKEKLDRYDVILQKYPSTPEAKKAAHLKAELLLKEKDYLAVLAMKDLLKQDKGPYNSALSALINQDMQENRCAIAAQYLGEISDFSEIKDKLKTFDCLYELNLNAKANLLAKSQIQDKNSKDYLPWLYRYAKNLYKLGKYQDSILASRDVLAIARAENAKQYEDILFTLFDALALSNLPEATNIYGSLEQNFPNDPRMLSVYFALLNQKDIINSAKLVYATKLYDLQKSLHSSDYSPFVDFMLIDALKQGGDNARAYEVATKLIAQKLSDPNKQRALYIKADLEIKQGKKKQASATLKQCTDIAEQSSWKTLCAQSKDLLKE
ncbi:tetratricopeptide repeat protein [Helicobacter mustelae]|uniref:Putative paralysed flagellum protein, PflA n=1 Tax=Helicobacter mustelae (strain ATCC 43772 / CCUG 25715 / CIP 103759 / LMG 18044 / NCTC 12198 / R85-136P) TaxID=679897 RepID=D3UJH4_HELM1|nr:tetratricopeptide repeat protein [Helicobacter mustelae]CBG40650.1 putative paralysed flagellum protein, PflA [Helicobacter mustelae 12198]